MGDSFPPGLCSCQRSGDFGAKSVVLKSKMCKSALRVDNSNLSTLGKVPILEKKSPHHVELKLGRMGESVRKNNKKN